MLRKPFQRKVWVNESEAMPQEDRAEMEARIAETTASAGRQGCFEALLQTLAERLRPHAYYDPVRRNYTIVVNEQEIMRASLLHKLFTEIGKNVR